MKPKTSLVVPSKGCRYLRYLFWSLSKQSSKPDEVIIISKDCDVTLVEGLCAQYSLNCVVIEQTRGYFTHALNMGKKACSGDLILFTDDDAIVPRLWIARYVRLFSKLPRKVAAISSRDIYVDLNAGRLLPTSDDRREVKLYRWLIRTWLEQPLPLLSRYRLGVYLTWNLDVAHGPYIPSRACYSLPFRGVNMAFRKEALDESEFPEHPRLKRAPGNEQYVGLQLALKSWESIYVPNNPVLHIAHESLSRINRSSREELYEEMQIMRSLYAELLNGYSNKNSTNGLASRAHTEVNVKHVKYINPVRQVTKWKKKLIRQQIDSILKIAEKFVC